MSVWGSPRSFCSKVWKDESDAQVFLGFAFSHTNPIETADPCDVKEESCRERSARHGHCVARAGIDARLKGLIAQLGPK
jgi:hypothetical protein